MTKTAQTDGTGGVGDGGELLFRLVAIGPVPVAEPAVPFRQEGLPVLIGLLLGVGVGLLGGELLVGDPPTSDLLAAEALPGRLTARVEG